jgi:hypothetical protein
MKLTRDLKEFIELLNANGVEYLLVGGWAFGFHATPRYTGDIDFFVKCDEQNATRLKTTLIQFGFTELDGFEASFLDEERILQFGVPPNRIDILTKISGVKFDDAWQSKIAGDLDGIKLPIISREFMIRNKTAAGRLKDMADVEALAKTKPDKIP